MKIRANKYLILIAFIASQGGHGNPSVKTDISLPQLSVRYECGESLSLWAEEGSENWIETACKRLQPVYLKLKAHSIYKDALSKPVSVLLVSKWDRGSGFAAEQLEIRKAA